MILLDLHRICQWWWWWWRWWW